MKNLLTGLIVILLLVCVLAAGCSQSPSDTVPTQAVTAIPTQMSLSVTETTARPAETISGPGTPGPTQMLPPDYLLGFQVQANGDTVKPEIYVTLSGGNGMNLDSLYDATLYRTDSNVNTQVRYPPFRMGDTMIFPSTTSNYNRIVITVTAPQVGKVTVRDEYVPFKTINP